MSQEELETAIRVYNGVNPLPHIYWSSSVGKVSVSTTANLSLR